MRKLACCAVAAAFVAVPGSAWASRDIQGGTTVSAAGAWPWMVSIVGTDSSLNPIDLCSGELIGPTTVLTAAHCFNPADGATHYVVSPARYQPCFNDGTPCTQATPYEVLSSSAATPNPGFVFNSTSSPYDDVGVLQLSAPLAGTSWLPVVQPNQMSPFQSAFTGLAAGYGITTPNGQTAGQLYQIEDDNGSAVLDNSGAGNSGGALIVVTNAGAKGTCEGDSGGPLLVPIGGGAPPVSTNPSPSNGDWAVIGSVSKGPSGACNQTDYTNVAYNVSGPNDVATWLLPHETPVNFVAPAITGTAAVGKQLSCSSGTWSVAVTPTYQWDTVGTGSPQPIGGATSSTFTPTSDQAGQRLECIVTGTFSGMEAAGQATSPAVGPVAGGCVPSGNTVSCTYGSTGAEQSLTLPSGVHTVHVLAVGGTGGAGGGASAGSGAGGPGGAGGFGAQVSGQLAVTAGTTLHVDVGANGSAGASSDNCSVAVSGGAGGFDGGALGGSADDGGGGGGGASDIRTVSDAHSGTLASRLVVAGGGGGGGGCGGGQGGNAGAAGATATGAGAGGGAGTASGGGTGGTGSGGASTGAVGASGNGGAGGAGTNDGGGGGGGGYWGGGGGGGNSGMAHGGGGGGGGGSSFTGTLTGSSVATDSTGTPRVVISYTIPYTLTVAKAGTGSGAVTSSPTGISCGSTCSSAYPAGTVVTLTAKPASGSKFAGWSGACTGTGTCQVTLTAASAVTATFTAVPPPSTKITGAVISAAKRKATFDFTGSGGVGALHFLCKLDAGSWHSCTSPETYTGLSVGSHTFEVRAVDAQGKADPTPAKHAFTI